MGLITDEVKARGMGAMTKKEYDVFVVRELMKSGITDAYKLSLLLKVPTNRIAKIIDEINLRFSTQSIEEQSKNVFLNTLHKCQILNDGNNVRFILNDSNTRNYVENILNSELLFYDYSFKKDVIVIPSETLIKLLEVVCNTHELSEKLDEINKKLDDSKPKIAWKDVLIKLAGEIVGSAVGSVAGAIVCPFVKISIDKIIKALDSFK
ncbi:MAG: hypothetical protein J5588_03575 [Bacteroidales bacterium]|nr:hypothetical protein [Bacteroidales bacterium]